MNIIPYTCLVDVTVMFNQSVYNVNENGIAQPVLVLSGLSSIDITVLVKDVPKSAISE